MERRQEAKLYEKVNFLLQMVQEQQTTIQEQGATMAVMQERIDQQDENEVQRQEQINRLEDRIHELENPRRSRRILGIRAKNKKKK